MGRSWVQSNYFFQISSNGAVSRVDIGNVTINCKLAVTRKYISIVFGEDIKNSRIQDLLLDICHLIVVPL